MAADDSQEAQRTFEQMLKEMQTQNKNIVNSANLNVDVGNRIKKLEGTFGLSADTNSALLKEEFGRLQKIMDDQVALQEAGLPFDQELLKTSQEQVEALSKGIQSEEDRREAVKKQEEANSLLMKMSNSFDKGLGKLKETGGFLAGLGALALLALDPETFIKGVKMVMEIFGDIFEVIGAILTLDPAKIATAIKDNFSSIMKVFAVIAFFKLPKILKGVFLLVKNFPKIVRAFKTFAVFMKSQFIPNTITTLRSAASSVGTAFMKIFNGLKSAFILFKGFMVTTFIPTVVSTLKGAASAVGAGFLKAFSFLSTAFGVFGTFMKFTLIPSLVAGFAAMKLAMAPMLAALGPILVPVLAIAAILGGLALGLKFIKEKMGFESILDALKYSFLLFADFISMIVNAVTFIPRKIIGFLGKTLAWMLGLDSSKFDAISDGLKTDRAKEFRERKQKVKDEVDDQTAVDDAAKNFEANNAETTEAYSDMTAEQQRMFLEGVQSDAIKSVEDAISEASQNKMNAQLDADANADIVKEEQKNLDELMKAGGFDSSDLDYIMDTPEHLLDQSELAVKRQQENVKYFKDQLAQNKADVEKFDKEINDLQNAAAKSNDVVAQTEQLDEVKRPSPEEFQKASFTEKMDVLGEEKKIQDEAELKAFREKLAAHRSGQKDFIKALKNKVENPGEKLAAAVEVNNPFAKIFDGFSGAFKEVGDVVGEKVSQVYKDSGLMDLVDKTIEPLQPFIDDVKSKAAPFIEEAKDIFNGGIDAIFGKGEAIVQKVEPTTGEQMMATSAENTLAATNAPAKEVNAVTQVSNASSNNSNNVSNVSITQKHDTPATYAVRRTRGNVGFAR